MFHFNEKIFIGISTVLVNATNQKCTTQHILTNLHPNEYTQGLCYYPFAINLDRCTRSYNTLNESSNKIYFKKN